MLKHVLLLYNLVSADVRTRCVLYRALVCLMCLVSSNLYKVEIDGAHWLIHLFNAYIY